MNSPVVDIDALVAQRRTRLLTIMEERGISAILTADPFSIRYATGTRNMLVHGLTGPDRLTLVTHDGRATVWEFAGCEHLWADHPGIDDIRPAPALNAKKSPDYLNEAARFALEVRDLVRQQGTNEVAVESIDPPAAAALENAGLSLLDANAVFQHAMAIKQPAEIQAMRAAVCITEAATSDLERAIVPGRTEQEVWAEFHRSLIAMGGELVVTRLLQSGHRTFPYFQEASDHVLDPRALVCFDTDAVALHGYSVDFSRTFLCGEFPASAIQRKLYGIAHSQLLENACNLEPGRSFREFADRAFNVPEPYRQYGYYQLAHGLGLAGGQPNIPRRGPEPYPLPGVFEPGMVICVESYVGDPESRQGIKLEDQYLITSNGAEAMTTYAFDNHLLGSA